MKKLAILIFTVFITISTAIGQIDIGQDAEQIKSFIEASTIDHNTADINGNTQSSYCRSDVKYYNGEITDVIQCYRNQYLLDLGSAVSFCKHYIMERGKLDYILTQYEDISLDKLKSNYEENYKQYKIGELYFSEDYKHFSKIYLAQNGYPSVEWHKSVPNILPSNIQASIQIKTQEQEQKKQKRKQEEAAKYQKEDEIKSKTYDLAIYDSNKYNTFIDNLCISLANKLKSNSSFPNWSEIETYPQKYFSFKNSYAANYKLVDYSLSSTDKSYRNTEQFTLLSGTDNSFSFIKSVAPALPKIYIQGITVMPEATIIGIDVSYTKGITNVKIKNGTVTYKKFPPSEYIQRILSEKLRVENDGTYFIRYEVGNAMRQSFITIDKQY